MPISGLVITFTAATEGHDQTLAEIDAQPAIEIGARSGHKCAIVIDSPSKADDKELVNWVRELPGVADVQVAFVGFDEAPTDQAPSDQRSTLPDSTG